MEKLQLLEYKLLSSSENHFLSRDFFPTTTMYSSSAEMILRKFLILSADTDMLGLSPFDVALLLVWIPSY